MYVDIHNSIGTAYQLEKDIGQIHQQIAENLRASKANLYFPTLPVEDLDCAFDIQTHPIIFQEVGRYISDNKRLRRMSKIGDHMSTNEIYDRSSQAQNILQYAHTFSHICLQALIIVNLTRRNMFKKV